jgi:hypothetical protein
MMRSNSVVLPLPAAPIRRAIFNGRTPDLREDGQFGFAAAKVFPAKSIFPAVFSARFRLVF